MPKSSGAVTVSRIFIFPSNVQRNSIRWAKKRAPPAAGCGIMESRHEKDLSFDCSLFSFLLRRPPGRKQRARHGGGAYTEYAGAAFHLRCQCRMQSRFGLDE